MLQKRLHFISGLPRAGATLLSNILSQNPQFHLASPPGILDVMFIVRRQWNQVVEFQATPNEAGKLRVLRGIFESFYSAGGVTQPVIFDKSRAWLGMIEMAEKLLETEVRILVPVRDIRDVLSSFEKLWRANQHMRQITETAAKGPSWETVQGRCALWLQGDQPIGLCYNRIKDAITRGYADRLHFIDYDQLTRDPERILSGIYEFLGEEPFEHDFNNVSAVTTDLDEMYQIPGIPAIRPKVEAADQPQWPMILGATGDQYGHNNLLWRRFTQPAPDLAAESRLAAPAFS